MSVSMQNLKYKETSQPLRYVKHIWVEKRRPHQFSRTIALVIGIDEYTASIPSLASAVNDARHLAHILWEKHDYDVLLVDENATQNTILELLTETLPAQLDADSRLLFYFAGHGIALDSDDGPHGYLVPSDACLEDKTTLLSMHTIYRALHDLPCRHMLAILDCCFAGAFRWSSLRDLFPLQEILYEEQFARFIQDPAWQVITSADYDQKALDYLTGDSFGERGDTSYQELLHSPFALALFDALEGKADISPPAKNGQLAGDGIITATELILYLREHVEFTTQSIGNRQTPMLWPLQKHDKGEYVFAVPDYGEPQLPPAPILSIANNPYRGLQPFNEEHTNLFFGRQTLTQNLFEKVVKSPLTVVLGASGSGKSSLVKAGLFPELRMQKADEWHLLPSTRPAEKPLTLLTNVLATLSAHVGQPVNHAVGSEALSYFAWQEPLTPVVQWCRLYPQKHLLLCIDQFEELITQCADEDERERFMALLAALIQIEPSRIHLVLTLRSDFESQFAHQNLAPYWHAARFIVMPMSRSELWEVVEGPAAERVLFFDPAELVDQIIDEVIQSPGALPLLSFTLSELYLAYLARNQKNRALTQEDYEQLGGVIGSLRYRATEEYNCLDVAEQATMRRVLLRMVSLESSELTRRRVLLTELEYPDPEENLRVHKILEQLTNHARLLVKGSTDSSVDQSEAYVEPAHDALIQGWDLLLKWVLEAKEYLPLQRRLTQAAIEWDKREHKPDHLWHADPRIPQLQQVLSGDRSTTQRKHPRMDTMFQQMWYSLWPSIALPRSPTWLNQKETVFVQQSILHKARELRRRVFVVVVAFVALATLSDLALNFWTRYTAEQRVSATNEFHRLAIEATGLLARDRVASLQVGLEALQNPLFAEAEVPEVEFVMAQALNSSLERKSLPMRIINAQQVALGSALVAVAGQQLQLLEQNLEDNATIDEFDEPQQGVHWAPNGDLLSYDNHTVFVWRENLLIAQYELGSDATIHCVQWRPDSKTIAICHDGQLLFWQVGETIPEALSTELTDIADIRWSPDGSRFITWDREPSSTLLRLWRGEQSQPFLIELDAPITGAAFLTDRDLTTWGSDGAITRWSITGLPIHTYRDSNITLPIRGQALSNDGKRLLVYYIGGKATLWNIESGDKIATLDSHQNTILAAEWQGDLLATASADQTVRLWDGITGEPITVLAGHTGAVLGLHWLDNGQLLSYGQINADDVDDSLRIWQVLDDKNQPICWGLWEDGIPQCHAQSQSISGYQGNFTFARWLDNDTFVATDLNGIAGRHHRLHRESGENSHNRSFTLAAIPQAENEQWRQVVWNHTGTEALTYIRGSGGQLWHLDGSTWRKNSSVPGPIFTAFWLEPYWLIVDDNGTARWLTVSGEQRQAIETQMARITDAQLLNEMVAIAGVDDDGAIIRVWNLASGALLSELHDERSRMVDTIRWNEAGSQLLATTKDPGLVMLWAVADNQTLWSFVQPTANAPKAEFSPDEAYVAVAINSKFYLLNATDGHLLWAGVEHTNTISGIQWSNDSSRLLTWSYDGSVRLWRWDGATAIELQRTASKTSIYLASINPDGTNILVAGTQGDLRVWEAWPDPASLRRKAQECCLSRSLSTSD